MAKNTPKPFLSLTLPIVFICIFIAACGEGKLKQNPATTAASGLSATSSDIKGILAADARFSYPVGIAADSAGNLYVTDTGNYTVRRISVDGFVTTVAGSAGGRGNVGGAVATARFEHPTGIAVDSSGNLYVIDSNAIRKITQAGGVSTIAGSVAESGYADRKGAEALFSQPEGIAAGPDGNLYVADTGNRAIRRIYPSGAVDTLLKIDMEPIHSIAASGSRLYVGGENCMWRIELSSSGGTVLARMGGDIGVYGNVDSSSGALFWPLRGIAADQAGNVYAAEAFAYPRQRPPVGVIRKMTPTANGLTFTASTLAGDPAKAGSADGVGAAALFNFPMGIAVGANGNLYVTDSNNHSIRVVTPSGTVTTLAGKPGEKGSS